MYASSLMNDRSIYALSAGFLWGIVGVLAGFNLAVLAGWDTLGRTIATIVGIVAAAILVRWMLQRSIYQASPETPPAPPLTPPPTMTAPTSASRPVASLSPSEARQWLDDFLIKQQNK